MLFYDADHATKSVAAMAVFIMAMTCNPYILKKAQAEIDRVIGNDRLPAPEDRDSLPYLECIMQEVLRRVTLALL